MTYDFDDVEEVLADLSEYYSEITGRSIDFGVDSDGDIWFNSSRTNGREYVDTVEEVERRVKLLYQDLIEDTDYDDEI
jgi:hypothetical protein